MIILDTHIWIWWVQGDSRLTQQHQACIQATNGLGISLYSCWEVAKLVEYSRLVLLRRLAQSPKQPLKMLSSTISAIAVAISWASKLTLAVSWRSIKSTLLQFIQASQPQAWQKLSDIHGLSVESKFILGREF